MVRDCSSPSRASNRPEVLYIRREFSYEKRNETVLNTYVLGMTTTSAAGQTGTIRPFTIAIPQQAVDDLQRRLANTATRSQHPMTAGITQRRSGTCTRWSPRGSSSTGVRRRRG